MLEMRDGARIPLHTTGSGPQIVVAHGGGVTIDIYRRLAQRLSGRFTVHLYNRRGRGDAPLLATTLDDSAAILEHGSSAAQWAGIEAETLLICGKSGPPYYPLIHEALATAIPKARTLVLPHGAHDALARAHPGVVEPLIEFFGDSSRG